MPRCRTRVCQRLSVEYGLLTVAVPGACPLPAIRPYGNGLVVPVPPGRADGDGAVAVLQSATRDDDIQITVEDWDSEPSLRTDGWQDVVDTGIDWPGGPLRVTGTPDGPFPAVPLGDLPAGPYRLRVHGRHRDDGEARGPQLPVEEYLLQLWPAAPPDPAGGPVRAERVWKATSALGAYWRAAGATGPPG